jgi:hypothetical protein
LQEAVQADIWVELLSRQFYAQRSGYQQVEQVGFFVQL